MTAVANAKATRSVIYPNSDGSKKLAKSKTVPGFKPVPADNFGQNAFVGTVTQGGETHIGLGALHSVLIVGATLAGYDPTP